ncbi:MAG: hypothetical protein ABIJ59_14440 [Pseudomonadota bacterium]
MFDKPNEPGRAGYLFMKAMILSSKRKEKRIKNNHPIHRMQKAMAFSKGSGFKPSEVFA